MYREKKVRRHGIRALSLRAAFAAAALGALCFAGGPAAANDLLQESVTGGSLDLTWSPGFGIQNNLLPVTLGAADPGYANPSGDHTVGNAFSSFAPDSGGLCIAGTDPGGVDDYGWEGWIFTGDGNTRRGLFVRGDPNALFGTCYTFVIEPGLLQLNFRKLTGQGSVGLASWLTTDTPSGFPAANSWHHMKVVTDGSTFQLHWDGYHLPGVIVDASYPTGWVGVFNFRFDLGHVDFLVDDLILSGIKPTATEPATWGGLKGLYR